MQNDEMIIGGNTIYRIDHPEDGKGTQSAVYQIYNCS
jgi:hypothetical protein